MKQYKYFLFFVFLIPLVQGNSWCYQETANKSTECGGLSTGNYQFSKYNNFSIYNLVDEDYDTYGYYIDNSIFRIMYTNYTKPEGVVHPSLWQLGNTASTQNVTFPEDCLDYNEDKIVLRTTSFNVTALDGCIYYCYNGTEFKTVQTTYNEFCTEEAMFWNITQTEQQTTTKIFSVYSGSKIKSFFGKIMQVMIQ